MSDLMLDIDELPKTINCRRYIRQRAHRQRKDVTALVRVNLRPDFKNCFHDVTAEVVRTVLKPSARLVSAGLTPGDIKEMSKKDQAFGKFFFIQDPDG